MNIKILASLLVLTDPLQAARLLRGEDPITIKDPTVQVPKKGFLREFVKSTMSRKAYDMQITSNEVFKSMGVLKSDKSYSIKIYRGGKTSTHHAPLFKSTPEDVDLKNDEKLKLIQTTPLSDSNKNLCIMTVSKEFAINNDMLQQFTREITATNDGAERDLIFKKYKNEIGLPGLGTDFSYNIYAWETNYDCGLYNVGLPEAYFPPKSIKQSMTGIFSHSSADEYNYAVQLTKVSVNNNLVSIMQIKSDEMGPSSLRIQPLGYFYKSFADLFKQFSPAEYETLTIGDNEEKCVAFFYQTKSVKPFESAEIIDQSLELYNRQGISSIRTKKFAKDSDFVEFLGYFSGSHTVTCAIWPKKDGKCGISSMDDDEDGTDMESMSSETSNVTNNNDLDSDVVDYQQSKHDSDSDDDSDYESGKDEAEIERSFRIRKEVDSDDE